MTLISDPVAPSTPAKAKRTRKASQYVIEKMPTKGAPIDNWPEFIGTAKSEKAARLMLEKSGAPGDYRLIRIITNMTVTQTMKTTVT